MSKNDGKKRNIYYGWWMVFLAFMILALQFNPAINLVGLFVESLELEFNATRTEVTTISTICILATMLGSFFAGGILVRHKIKKVIIPALIISCVCYFGNMIATSLFQLYILAFIRGICNSFATTLPSSIIINNWFGTKAKGKALGISVVGSGVGAIVLTPIIRTMIINFGWRISYSSFGLLSLALIPMMIFIFKFSPEEMGIARLGDEEGVVTSNISTGMTSREAVKTSTFWLLVIVFIFSAGVSQTWNSNSATFLNTFPFGQAEISALLTITPIALTVGKIVLGSLFDKIGSKKGTIFGVLFLTVSNIIFLVSGLFVNEIFLGIGVFSAGFGMAVINVALPLVVDSVFKSSEFGILVGYMQVAANCGSSVLPLLFSIVYDKTEVYSYVWGLGIILTIIVVFLVNKAYNQPRKANV